MANFFDVTSDKADIFLILVDSSGSMDCDEQNVRKGLRLFKESFNDFEFANSVIVSVCKFDDNFYPGEFRKVKEMNTEYYANNAWTALNYAIVEVEEFLSRYVQEFIERKGISPKVTFVCISDGRPEHDKLSTSEGKEAIRKLNYAGVTTAFAALGHNVDSSFGRDMGFIATIDVTDRNTLLNFLGVELSNSCKEQSQSMKSLGANFFSKANEKSKSQEYSQATAQALGDTSWIDEI